jgi:hypothetical protein
MVEIREPQSTFSHPRSSPFMNQAKHIKLNSFVRFAEQLKSLLHTDDQNTTTYHLARQTQHSLLEWPFSCTNLQSQLSLPAMKERLQSSLDPGLAHIALLISRLPQFELSLIRVESLIPTFTFLV